MNISHDSEEFGHRAVASRPLRDLARGLRKRQTDAEQVLWEKLRDHRLGGLKFRRQHPVAGTTYIADFCCYQARLLIELDGGIHIGQVKEDRNRQVELEEQGYRVLRYSNERVLREMDKVLSEIASAVARQE
ncbi:MAG: DUF559 domain-containing protein [Anaerolineaceae bacterium]|nr:DUF559 domain-containing protein [Anaerolineaceae bacterium]MDE0328092.1 DUF559 domain-containing protein [Anaerolineaceae bacterium]MDE0608652.1 DUF559 domain-containing protein [Anaerolineaceae bacterium]